MQKIVARNWLAAIATFGLSSNAAALSVPIDVMVIYPNDTSLNYAQRIGATQLIQTALNDSFAGMDPVFSVTHIFPKMPYNHAGDSQQAIHDKIRGENANPQSWLRSYRDNIDSGSGADLVVFVADYLAPDACGAVTLPRGNMISMPPTQVLPIVSEDFFAAIIQAPSTPGCTLPTNLAHEIGHLLYAEAEFSDPAFKSKRIEFKRINFGSDNPDDE